MCYQPKLIEIPIEQLDEIEPQLRLPKLILSCKLDDWKYEKEIRVFGNDNNTIEASVKKIIFGFRMPKKDSDEISGFIKSLNLPIKIEFETRDMLRSIGGERIVG